MEYLLGRERLHKSIYANTERPANCLIFLKSQSPFVTQRQIQLRRADMCSFAQVNLANIMLDQILTDFCTNVHSYHLTQDNFDFIEVLFGLYFEIIEMSISNFRNFEICLYKISKL